MPRREEYDGPCCVPCCVCLANLVIALVVFPVVFYGVLHQVRVTVTDASLSRFALAGANGTALLAYDLSLTVSVENPNEAMRAVNTAPLEADIRFAGRRFDGARLAAKGGAIPEEKSTRFHLAAAGEVDAAQALGSDGVAELVRETVAGTIQSLDLKLSGEVMYRPVHVGRFKLSVTCPLRLQTATPQAGTNVKVLDEVIKCP
ncbi:hypothetical protein EJB05_46974, partial [Eragrostis curvula]